MTPAHIKVLCALALLIALAWLTGRRAQQGNAAVGRHLHRISSGTLVVLSLVVLLAVLGGYFFPQPSGDEGVAAHLFQLGIVAAALAGTLSVSTAQWREGWLRVTRPLALPALVLALAFGMLYHLEHYYH